MLKYFCVEKYLEDWTLHIFFENIIKIEPFTDNKGRNHSKFYVIGNDEFEVIFILNSIERLELDKYDEFVALGDGSYATKQHKDMLPYLPESPEVPVIE